jgi:hypothetical protein
MNTAWLGLMLLCPSRFAAAATEVEAPDQRSYAEATPDMLARRARSCRADVKDYRDQPSLELLDRMIVCMEHPDPRLRAEILDQIPERRLWDRPDYETKVAPELGKIYVRFQHDPDERVRMHAGQLGGFLSNGQQWRDWDSPAAQQRRRAEEQRPRRHSIPVDGQSAKLGDYALAGTIVAVLLVGLVGRLFKVG